MFFFNLSCRDDSVLSKDIGIFLKNLTLNYSFPFTLADSNEDEEMEEEKELLAQNEVKDPRAGNVSVSLPQLKADFNQLADHLYKVGKLQGRRKV